MLYILTSMIYVSSGVMMVLATLSSSSQTACTSVDGSPVDGENHYGNHLMLEIFSIHCTILGPLAGRGRYSLPLPFGTKNTCRVTVCSHYHSDITFNLVVSPPRFLVHLVAPSDHPRAAQPLGNRARYLHSSTRP